MRAHAVNAVERDNRDRFALLCHRAQFDEALRASGRRWFMRWCGSMAGTSDTCHCWSGMP